MKRFIQMEQIHALCMLAFALVLGAGAATAQTIAPMVTNFDYSGYTFQYTEGGVTKTANLTDEATTPDHIIALLKAVYTDKTIPGTLYGYHYPADHTERPLNYATYANQGTPWTKGTVNATTYPNPDQEGMTLLLVQMKEGWKSSTPGNNWNDYKYIENAYSSVKLITNFTRVHDQSNPGYLFSIDGATNRFFFIAKGKPRYTYTRPLYRLFEQISPVNTNDGSAATYDFIAKMRSGESYLCYHDCGDVGTVGDGHWFTLSQQGEAYSLKNLTIFIPDRRFEDNRSNADNSNFYCYYGNSQNKGKEKPEQMPKVLMYTATLNAKATPSETSGYYQVDLDWETSFTQEKIGSDVPQHYYVYILNADNTRTLIEEVTKDANGLVVTKHHDYLVQQTTDQQTISYVVTAQTINYDNDGNIIMGGDGKPMTTLQAETPVRSVIIPGYSPFFTQASEFRSRFDIPNQVNIYKNKMSIRPTTINDYYAIKNNQEEYEVTRTDANGEKVTVAWVQFTQQEGQTGYDYTVRYNADTQVTQGLVFDGEQPTTSGRISNFDESEVFVIDRFTASTQTNEQPNKYTYQFEQNEGKYSNALPVPVYKTTNEVNGIGYTLEEVKADTDHSLRAAPCNEITYHAIYDPAANLAEYDVIRLDNDYNEFKVSKADHFNNSGEYHVFAVGPDGNLNQPVYDPQPKFGTDGGDITVPDKNASVDDEVSRYVPVIITLYGGDQFKHNTYGCDIKQMSYPQLEVEVSDLIKTNPYAGKDRWVRSYGATLKLTPQLPADVKNVYYYRVWRVMDGTLLADETLLNTVAPVSGETDGNEWGNNLEEIKQIYPGSEPITITDFFTEASDGSREVTYIVRLYSTNVDGDQGDPIDTPRSAKSRTTIDGKDYLITEQKITVNYAGDQVITGIKQLAHDGEVESILYYNVMGIPSTVPYSGINLMSVRYRDGRTVTSKVVR